jgi:Chaperone of endosialidase
LARFSPQPDSKKELSRWTKATKTILALKPVTFRYKHELGPAGVPELGLVAEEVEKVNPDLVVRDQEGKVITARYEAVNATLLNEFLIGTSESGEAASHSRESRRDSERAGHTNPKSE